RTFFVGDPEAALGVVGEGRAGLKLGRTGGPEVAGTAVVLDVDADVVVSVFGDVVGGGNLPVGARRNGGGPLCPPSPPPNIPNPQWPFQPGRPLPLLAVEQGEHGPEALASVGAPVLVRRPQVAGLVRTGHGGQVRRGARGQTLFVPEIRFAPVLGQLNRPRKNVVVFLPVGAVEHPRRPVPLHRDGAARQVLLRVRDGDGIAPFSVPQVLD